MEKEKKLRIFRANKKKHFLYNEKEKRLNAYFNKRERKNENQKTNCALFSVVAV